MRVAMKTSTYDPIITTSFIGMGTIAGLEAFEWLQTEPRIMTAANMIGRIMDDIASHKVYIYMVTLMKVKVIQ